MALYMGTVNNSLVPRLLLVFRLYDEVHVFKFDATRSMKMHVSSLCMALYVLRLFC